jgi:hypothetical protein
VSFTPDPCAASRRRAARRLPRGVRTVIVSRLIGLFLLLAGFRDGTLLANTADYTKDEVLNRTMVNITSIKTRAVTLPEIFSLVETQTSLRFVYAVNQISRKPPMLLKTSDTVSLARLLSDISLMVDVVFRRANQQIIVRALWPEDKLTAAPVPSSFTPGYATYPFPVLSAWSRKKFHAVPPPFPSKTTQPFFS